LESLVQDLKLQPCGLAAHGEAAIEQAAELEPNLLLMDINLGTGMDGIEAARRIRETIDAAVIFVTAYNDPATLERIERAFPGAPVLAKPVTLEALRAAIVVVRKTKLD
jgi:CheY-like chemotaxis protein